MLCIHLEFCDFDEISCFPPQFPIFPVGSFVFIVKLRNLCQFTDLAKSETIKKSSSAEKWFKVFSLLKSLKTWKNLTRNIKKYSSSQFYGLANWLHINLNKAWVLSGGCKLKYTNTGAFTSLHLILFRTINIVDNEKLMIAKNQMWKEC